MRLFEELEKCEEEMEKAGMVVEIKCPEFDAFEKEMGEEDGAFEEIGEERLTSGTAWRRLPNNAMGLILKCGREACRRI